MLLDYLAIALIILSAIFKGIALKHLSDQTREIEVRKKYYGQFNMMSYVFLLPGVAILAYTMFFM